MDEFRLTRHPEVPPTRAPDAPEAPPAKRPLHPALLALAYPFLGRGKYMFGIGAVLLGAAKWALGLATGFLFSGAPNIVVGTVLLLSVAVILGYMALYLIGVVGSVAGGDDEPPDWPDVQSWMDAVRGLLLLAGAVGMYFSPAACFGWWGRDCPGYEAIYWALLGLGIVCLPMGLLAVAIFDSLNALNPYTVVRGVVKAGAVYLLAYAAVPLAILVYPALPFLFVMPLAGEAVVLYLLVVQMRLIGLVYRMRRKRLDWFVEE